MTTRSRTPATRRKAATTRARPRAAKPKAPASEALAVTDTSSGRYDLSDDAIQREILSLRSEAGALMSKVFQEQYSAGSSLRLGDVDEEYVPDLRRLESRLRVYDRMVNDPRVRGQIRPIWMTMLSGVRFKAEGGTPDMRRLIESNLLRKRGSDPSLWMNRSWVEFLYECFGCLSHGFSMFGKVRETVGDRVIFRDLVWLHPKSIDENGWEADGNDNLIEVRRTFTDPTGRSHTLEPIDGYDLFLVTWDRRGPNWEGNAFIRPMYKPWRMLEMAEKINVIDLQNRGVGIPVAKLSGQGGPKERDTLLRIVKNLRGGSKELACIVLEKDEVVEFLTSTGNVKDASETFTHHGQGITKVGGTEYFDQATSSTGSRASASALATGFFINVDAIKVHLLDAINNGTGPLIGLVEELMYMNFPASEIREYGIPEITGTKVSPTEQLDNIPILGELRQSGVIPRSRKLANEVLDRLNYPGFSEKEWQEALAEESMLSASLPGGGAGRPPEAGEDDRGRDDRESRRFIMTSSAEKKTLTGASPRPRSPASWPWLRSTMH